MKYFRLVSASVLLLVAATGCRHKQPQTLPPPQAQAPAVTAPKPAPAPAPQTTQPVLQTAPQTAPASPPPSTPATPPETKTVQVPHHRLLHKKQTASTGSDASSNDVPASKDNSAPVKRASTSSASAAIGQLSAADAGTSPDHGRETRDLIYATQSRLAHLTDEQKSQHRTSLLQVTSFLDQAKQALGAKDLDGAQTLANKAKILLDELLK